MMRLRKLLVTAGLLAAALLMLFAAAPGVQAQEGEGEGDPDEGAALYAENCVVCHGEGGEGRVGASLSHVYGGIDPDAFLTDVISRGRQGTFMSPWSQEYGGPLTEDQILDIVAYIESWGTTVEPPLPAPSPPQGNIPPVPEIDGDPNAGYSIFQRNCVACHGEDGTGRAGATLTDPYSGIEPGALVLTTIQRGRDGTLMPPFLQEYGGPLTEQEVNDVAAYAFSLGGTSPEYVPQGEQPVETGGSALPLIIVAVGTVLLIFALGYAVQRRESSGS